MSTTTSPHPGPGPVRATRPTRRRRRPGATADHLPWPSLLVLATAAFVMVTGEMLPTAVLPQMSADLGVAESRTGLLVSVWAAVVVVATVPLVRLTARWDRRTVVTGAMGAFALAGAVVALAPTYPVAAGGRLLGAAGAGVLWATVNAHTADVVPDRHLARAVAVVLGGGTLGTVVGIPVASLAARLLDWRLAAAGVAVLGLLVAVAVRVVVVPPLPRSDDGAPAAPAPGQDAAGPRRASSGRVRDVVAVGALLAVLLVGHFAAYTFVTRLVDAPAAGLPGGVSTMLLVLGGTSALGLVLAGRADRTLERWLVVSAAGTALALLALLTVERHVVVAVAVVALWGLASGATPPLVQTLMLRRAGPALRDTAGMLIPVAFNLGIAVGAAAGSVVAGRAGVGAIPVPAAAVALAGTLGLAVVTGTVQVVRRAHTAGATPAPTPAPCPP